MKYQDEEIALRRYEEKRKQYHTVESGIYMGDDLIKFQEEKLFNDKLSVMLPENFKDMDVLTAKKKYSSEQRAQVIKTNKDNTVDFTFSLLENENNGQDLEQLSNKLINMLKGVYPSAVFGEKGEFGSEKKNGQWFGFQSFSLNGAVYNFLSLVSINDVIILGMFNCPYEQGSKWNTVFVQVAETIKITE